MPLESAPQNPLGQINPASLIGQAQPVVEPRATAALTDAFRQGVITADDIVNRFGELGKSQDKAQIQMNQEKVSPEQVAARAAQTQAATSGAQANDLSAQQQIRHTQFPGTVPYDVLAPGAGVFDKNVPVEKQNEIGSHLAAWDSTRKSAKATIDSLKQHVDPKTNILTWYEQGGGPVSRERKIALDAEANMPFQTFMQKFPGLDSSLFPSAGQSSANPIVEPIGTVTPEMRARVESKVGSAANVSAMEDRDILRLDQSGSVVTANTPPEQTAKPEVFIPSGSYQLGPPTEEKDKIAKAPTEAQQRAQLALGRFAQSGDMIESLKTAGYNPSSIGSWMNGMLPQIAKSGDRKLYEAAVDAWSQGLLRLESGAAISRSEKEWYDKAFFPQVNDPEKVQLSKEAMRHDMERMVAEIAQAGGVDTPESIAQTKRIYERAQAMTPPKTGGVVSGANNTGSSAGPVLSLQSGRKLQRDANGNYTVIQ